MKDRLSTRNILKRKNMVLDSYDCAFCPSAIEETVQHLFWSCPFAQQCWGWLNLQTVQDGDTFQNIDAIKDQLQTRFFMIPIIIINWIIWTARNEAIFKNNQIPIQECKRLLYKELRLVSLRVKNSLTTQFEQWYQNL
jgi:hypothetical protein